MTGMGITEMGRDDGDGEGDHGDGEGWRRQNI